MSEFGAKGAPADDTQAIQAALNVGMAVVADKPDYIVSETLELYNAFDLNGATIHAAPESNCTVIRSRNTKSALLIGGCIDGAVSEQENENLDGLGFAPTVHFDGCSSPTVANLRVENYRCSGLRMDSATGAKIGAVEIRHGFGEGATFSGERLEIGSIQVEESLSFPGEDKHPWGVYPNSMTINASDSTIESVNTIGCEWGFKAQDGCINLQIGSIVARGTFGGQAVKVQGKAEAKNIDVSIDRIEATGNYFTALYIYESENVSIGSYQGIDNGLGYLPGADQQNYTDVWVQNAQADIGEIHTTRVRGRGIDARYCGLSVGAVVCDNPGSFVLHAKVARVSIGDMQVSADQDIGHQLVHVYGGDTVQPVTVMDMTVGQQMAAGIPPTHVYEVGPGGHLKVDYLEMPASQWTVADNDYTSVTRHG